jgi:hypothetical protein
MNNERRKIEDRYVVAALLLAMTKSFPCINKSVIQSKAGLQSIVEAEVGENFLEGKPRELECRLSSTRGLE